MSSKTECMNYITICEFAVKKKNYLWVVTTNRAKQKFKTCVSIKVIREKLRKEFEDFNCPFNRGNNNSNSKFNTNSLIAKRVYSNTCVDYKETFGLVAKMNIVLALFYAVIHGDLDKEVCMILPQEHPQSLYSSLVSKLYTDSLWFGTIFRCLAWKIKWFSSRSGLEKCCGVLIICLTRIKWNNGNWWSHYIWER